MVLELKSERGLRYTRPDRNGQIHRLEVQEGHRRLVYLQGLPGGACVEPARTRDRVSLDAKLLGVEQLIGNLAAIGNANIGWNLRQNWEFMRFQAIRTGLSVFSLSLMSTFSRAS